MSTNSELEIRDQIVSSIAPVLKGMYPVKLAIALILCSTNNKNDSNNAEFTRENSHLMLVGDPGLGKSQLLKATSEIALRSVQTTGMGSSKAGLTAAAIRVRLSINIPNFRCKRLLQIEILINLVKFGFKSIIVSLTFFFKFH